MICSDVFVLISVIYGKLGVTGALDLVGQATSKATTYEDRISLRTNTHSPFHQRLETKMPRVWAAGAMMHEMAAHQASHVSGEVQYRSADTFTVKFL
jgi:hypothetical protein